MNQPIIDEDIQRILAVPLPWGQLSGKTILVTGAGGMIGGYCARVARELGHVETLSRENLYDKPDIHADFIIHAASPAGPRAYCANPVGTIRANTVGTESVLELARHSGSQGVLFLSSGEVYGDGAPAPCPETFRGSLDWLNPRNVYAQSKRAGEALCARYAQQGVPAKIARISHTYGPGMALDDGRVFADFVSDIVNKRDIVLKSDGQARRPFCYLADTVLGLFTILLKGEAGEAYNVGSEIETRIGDLAEMLSGMFPPLKVVRRERPKEDTCIPCPCVGGHLDTAKIRALGWNPTTGIEEGFRRTVESYDSQR